MKPLLRKSNFERTTVEVKPMAHQRASLAHSDKSPIVYDASDAGTGKTAVRVWSFAKRRKKNGKKALILAPRTLLRSAWANDFKKFAPNLTVSIATAANREKAFAVDADAYITNHDAVKWLAKKPKHWFAQFDELIIDEPTAFKHHASQRSRAAYKIREHFKYRRCMSATPNSNGICDIWHQVMLLDDGKRLGSSFYGFRNTVCVPKQVGRDRNAIEWTDKAGAEEAVFGLLSDIVIRHRIEDCVDIPPTHHYQIEYDLVPAQRKVYDQMEMAQLLVMKQGTAISAINAAAVATKLLQICSGAVYDNDSKYHLIDTGRYEMILDLVEARKHSLVFFNWKHQKDQLTKLAEARGITFCTLDGSAGDEERSAMVAAYQAGAYQVMFAHPRSAAHGLTLTKGTATIWSGPIYDLELFEQGNKRQARIGQKEKTEVIMILAKDTIEEGVYDLLMGKNARMKTLLDLFESLAKK